MKLPILTRQINIEDREKKPPRISGYAAVYYDGTPETEYELWTDLRERIMPGAFDQAIQDDDVRALFNHDPSRILGRTSAGTLTLQNKKAGLWYEIDPPDTDEARAVIESLRRGDLDGSSFSFLPLTAKWIKDDGIDIREIHKVQLFDVGPVTFPAYEATSAGVRARRPELFESLELERKAQNDTSKRAGAYRLRAADVITQIAPSVDARTQQP